MDWSEEARARLALPVDEWWSLYIKRAYEAKTSETYQVKLDVDAALGEIERLHTGLKRGNDWISANLPDAENGAFVVDILLAEVERLRDIIRREAWLEEASAKDIPGPYISYDDYEKANARAERAEAALEQIDRETRSASNVTVIRLGSLARAALVGK